MSEAPEIEFVFEPQEEGGYHVYAPDLPGLHTQGDSLDDATDNAREALELYVERLGWETVRQRGSHVRLRHPERRTFLVVPLHKELKRGTLRGILRDADVSVEIGRASCR